MLHDGNNFWRMRMTPLSHHLNARFPAKRRSEVMSVNHKIVKAANIYKNQSFNSRLVPFYSENQFKMFIKYQRLFFYFTRFKVLGYQFNLFLIL